MTRAEVVTIKISIPQRQIERLEEEIQRGDLISIADGVRRALTDYLRKKPKSRSKA